MSEPRAMLGRMVEITPEELTQLRLLAEDASRLSYHQSKGWFLPFLQAHYAQGRIIGEIIARSHAS